MFSLCSVPPMVVVVNLTGTTTHCGGAAAPPTFAGGCPPVAEPDAVLLDIVSPCVRATDLAFRQMTALSLLRLCPSRDFDKNKMSLRRDCGL